MPTPYGQDHFLDIAGSLLKPQGMIHFYTFKKDFEIEHFKKLLEEKGWQIDYYRKCGDVAPRVGRYVFDIFLCVDTLGTGISQRRYTDDRQFKEKIVRDAIKEQKPKMAGHLQKNQKYYSHLCLNLFLQILLIEHLLFLNQNL